MTSTFVSESWRLSKQWKLSVALIIVFETDYRQVYKALWKIDLDVGEDEKLKMPQRNQNPVSASPTLIPMQTPLFQSTPPSSNNNITSMSQFLRNNQSVLSHTYPLQFFSAPFYSMSKPSSKCPLIETQSKCNQYGRNLNIQHIVEYCRGVVAAV